MKKYSLESKEIKDIFYPIEYMVSVGIVADSYFNLCQNILEGKFEKIVDKSRRNRIRFHKRNARRQLAMKRVQQLIPKFRNVLIFKFSAVHSLAFINNSKASADDYSVYQVKVVEYVKMRDLKKKLKYKGNKPLRKSKTRH